MQPGIRTIHPIVAKIVICLKQFRVILLQIKFTFTVMKIKFFMV